MQIEKPSSFWQVAPCSQGAEGTPGCQKGHPTSSGTNKMSRGRRCVFLDRRQNLHHRSNVNMEVVFPHNCLNKLTKSTGKEQLLENSFPHLPPFTSHSMQNAENHIRKQHVCPLYIRAILEHSGANMEPNFFSQKILEQRSCERDLPYPACEGRNTQ